MNTAFGIIANLADDLRHLQRSEIAEVREEFREGQVGSSTMPQKRNPWNCEHVKSLWKAFAPRAVTFFMDQISEHQRDLTNSASQRFVADYIAGFASAAARMRSVVRGLGVNRARMAQNLRLGGDLIFSEALYILIATGGGPEAHERVRQSDAAGRTVGRAAARRAARRPRSLGPAFRRARPRGRERRGRILLRPGELPGAGRGEGEGDRRALGRRRPPDQTGAFAVSSVDKILILDFGSQSTQLIGRRIRQLGVFSEIVPGDTPLESLPLEGAKGIILSGSPSGVYEEGAPAVDRRVYGAGLPVLGICYGLHRLSVDHGGDVQRLGHREYGRARVRVHAGSALVRPRAR